MRLNETEQANLLGILIQVLGAPYKWAGEVVNDFDRLDFTLSPEQVKARGLDCSELVEYAILRGLHIKVKDGSYNQYDMSDPIPEDEAEVGDLVFRRRKDVTCKVCHVGIYIGKGFVIEATPPEVRQTTLEAFKADTARTYYDGPRRLNLAMA